MRPIDYIDDAELVEETLLGEVIQIELPLALRGERLDKALAKQLPDYSRSRIQVWLEAGLIRSESGVLDAKDSVLGLEKITISIPPDPQNSAFQAENIPLEIIYSDDHIAVIYKPFGMVVHPAVGNWSGTMLNALLHHFPECSEVPRAGIVHRLDKDTSGLLVVAKNLKAQHGLVKQLQDHSMERKYLALAWGRTPLEKIIHGAIGRDVRDRLKMSIVPNHGREATTHLKTLKHVAFEGKDISLITCVLETGRTHQIRVHLESLGHGLVGDPVYKNKIPHQIASRLQAVCHEKGFDIPGQLLHAGLLGFIHPIHGEHLRFQAKPPVGFLNLLDLLGIENKVWLREFFFES
jgi:23S rRNA pseudouridine1911/1915/1917 synthase